MAVERINRKKLIEELESIRMAFRAAHDFVARTKCDKVSLAASHFFVNRLVAKYGGTPVEDIEGTRGDPSKKLQGRR